MKLRFLLPIIFSFFSIGPVYANYDDCLNAYQFEQDDKVLELCRPLAEQGSLDAMTVIGMTYYYSEQYKDYKKAFEWLEKAAIGGAASAQKQLSTMYYLGKYISEDKVQAIEWVMKAAKQGEAQAQYHLSVFYQLGIGGLPKDDYKAFEWAMKSAEQDNNGGQLAVCQMYSAGKGVKQNYHQAFRWCKESAEWGNPLGQVFLASLYGGNNLGRRDFPMAAMWLFIAQKNIGKDGFITLEGDSDEHIKEQIQYLFTVLEKVLTPEQIAEAEREAKQWQSVFDARKKKEGRQITRQQ